MATRRSVAIAAAALVAAGALVLAGFSSNPTRSGAEAALGTRLDEVVAAGSPGALALVVDGSAAVRSARGLANHSTGAPLRTTARFRAGSITKTFVAVVVLQLVSEGSLELDGRVERWLPGLVAPDITVRHLLSHTSGLSDYVDDRAIVSGPDLDPATLTRRALARDPIAAPGERYAYSSTNYLLLGLLVERVTGESIARQLATRIFRPLDLRRTSFEPGVVDLAVHGYRRKQHDGIVYGDPVDVAAESAMWVWSAGAVVSDADDLVTFVSALTRGHLVRRSLLAEMVPAQGYGLGLNAFSTSCGTAVGHTGNVGGYVSVLVARPAAGRVVVIMANMFPLSPEADETIHRLLDEAVCDKLE